MTENFAEYENAKPPIVLDYGKNKPLGYRATQKLTRFFPITALPNTDLVRFIINSNGFWDPFSSYLRMTVKVKTAEEIKAPDTLYGAYNACQLDNSASSLIQTMSIVQNGVEIERIDRYEVLAGMLNDLFYSREQRIQRSYEGFGTGLPEVLISKNTDNSTTFINTAASTADSKLASLGKATSYAVNMFGGLPGQIPNSTSYCVTATSTTSSEVYASVNVSTPSPYFDGCNEPVLYGKIDKSSTSIEVADNTKMTFCIPLISGIFGILMPADEIKYIPMQFFPGMELNLRLNPYAFHNLNPSKSGDRNFEVIDCQLFVNIIHFDPVVNSSITNLVKEQGLFLHSCSFYYGPSHMIPAGGSFDTYPINMSFKSLRSLMFCLMPIAYRTMPYVREQRRKALNLTAMQVRIGGDLFPTFPIGNLGASSDSGNPSTNSDFLANLYKAIGRLHDTVNDSLVTTHTFTCGNLISSASSILATGGGNDFNRGGSFTDGTAKWFNYSAAVTGIKTNPYLRNSDSTTDPIVANAGETGWLLLDTTTNNFFVNQIVPRAIYGIDLDTITSDSSVISGINTLINKPFELIINGINQTGESCELNMFLYYDMVIAIGRDLSVTYLGRGG